jgi:hypothetical protein
MAQAQAVTHMHSHWSILLRAIPGCMASGQKTADCIIDALWCFYIDAGGFPTRIRCGFYSSFIKGKVYSFRCRKSILVGASLPNRQSQNGAVERQWRTATSMARALLVEARGTAKRYWFWALREAIIRMNLLPVRPSGPVNHPMPAAEEFQDLPDPDSPPSRSRQSACTVTSQHAHALTTPFELIYGIKPDYRTLYHWGCIGFYRRTRDSSGGRGQFDMHCLKHGHCYRAK